VQSSDVIITMGCGDNCPALDDPAGLGVAAVRPIRDEIGRRVRHLVDELVAGRGES
jgi:arsenate reductase